MKIRITMPLLALLGACWDERQRFGDAYPEGVELTPENVERAWKVDRLDTYWLTERVRCFLSPEQYQASRDELSALISTNGTTLMDVPEYWVIRAKYIRLGLLALLGIEDETSA